MEVALMVAGVSTGALVGAFTAFLFGRTLASQRREAPWMEEVPVDALVPWVPSKARRLECASLAGAREHLSREVAMLQQELELCRLAELRSVRSLRDKPLTDAEVKQHLSMLAKLGERLSFHGSLIASLPELAQGLRRRSPYAMSVLASFEKCLAEHATCVERRLLELCGVAMAPAPATRVEICRGTAAYAPSEGGVELQKPGGPSAVVEELESDDEPTFENFWEPAEESKQGRKRPASDMANDELVMLTLLRHGTAQDLSVVKGLTGADIKKVMAHRKKCSHFELDQLPAILGRKLAVRKLLKENA